MKYLYSVLIIVIGFFAIPLVLDYSGHVADHIRLMGKDGDDAPSMRYDRNERPTETSGTIAKPTEVKVIKE